MAENGNGETGPRGKGQPSTQPVADASETFLTGEVGIQDPVLFSTLRSLLETTRRWEQSMDQVLQSGAVPAAQLRADAHESTRLREALEGLAWSDDAEKMELLNVLTEWFKASFFGWVDSPGCDYCGGRTVSQGSSVRPNEEERAHLAMRTELHRCTSCGNTTRFPRYNDPIKLLETRRGRCGEWANCFGAIATALGIRTRSVQDFADHVWNECLVGDRWIHVDPCEGIVDRPLLYEKGWGKAVRRVVGVDPFGVVDCTRRYTVMPADDVTFGICCDVYTRYLRESLGDAAISSLERVDRSEKALLETVRETDEVLPGRTTGSVAWREQRGESGSGCGRDARICTRYRVAKMPEGAPLAGMRCASRASGENAPSESSNKAFDGSLVTKWLCFEKEGAWLELRLIDAHISGVASYSLTSAQDEPSRDPADWQLEMRSEDGEWVTVDTRVNVEFGARGETKVFQVKPCTLHSKEIRLVVNRVRAPAEANSVQLARFDLVPGG